jgi:hypothetical protein
MALKSKKPAKKYAYYDYSNGEDRAVLDLSGVMAWIKEDMLTVTHTDDQPEFTITPVWLTRKEYRELPEID